MSTLSNFGEFKFAGDGPLLGSSGRGWLSLAAELRAHAPGEIPAICPDQMEITLAIRGNQDAMVERRGNGRFQSTAVRAGTLWFCPIGVQEDSIRITAPLDEILHLYIPRSQFERMNDLASRPIAPEDLFYLADADDELVRQIGYRVLRELENESAGGRILVEQLSLSLAAHLLATHSPEAPTNLKRGDARGVLDERRLRRVLAHVEDNLDRDVTLAELADVACLSLHHFARAFREATGKPPHRYVSGRRLEQACRLLAGSGLSLAEIALDCRFSSQASFTRAFQRELGMTPGEYRRRASG
ncbi:MAG TPA: AraC family transcriptional regulator [Novosphingobium sp.]|nr:AraC family transcriptional regulator [Novosphingobium sp.]